MKDLQKLVGNLNKSGLI